VELCAQSCNRPGLILPSKPGLTFASASDLGFMEPAPSGENGIPESASNEHEGELMA
jgi:hypothetical protein